MAEPNDMIKTGARRAPRRALLQFGSAGFAVLVLLSVIGAILSRSASRDEAVIGARTLAEALGRSVVEANLRDSLLSGDPAAVALLDAEIVGHLIQPSLLVRVKIWTPDGEIVYSDEHRLIGARFELGDAETDLIASGGTDAHISDLDEPENVYERDMGTLLEVYVVVHTPSGAPLLFETYAPLTSIADRAESVWLQFLPITLGGLVLLELIHLPLAWGLARRLERAQEARETMLRGSIRALDDERRRIAADLHDGVVQDLAAASYTLVGSATEAGRTADSTHLLLAADAMRGAIRSIRALLVDIYPPNLSRAGLAAALQDVAATVVARGLPVDVVVDQDARGSDMAEQLVLRAAQEALRNAASHASATSVRLCLERLDSWLVLTVADDGVGFDTAAPADPDAGDRPHLGLVLLRDLAVAASATLEIDSTPGSGTHLRLAVPSR